MSELKVEGFENLVRDTESTAIVNKDSTGYEMYMRKVSLRKNDKEFSISPLGTLYQELNVI